MLVVEFVFSPARRSHGLISVAMEGVARRRTTLQRCVLFELARLAAHFLMFHFTFRFRLEPAACFFSLPLALLSPAAALPF